MTFYEETPKKLPVVLKKRKAKFPKEVYELKKAMKVVYDKIKFERDIRYSKCAICGFDIVLDVHHIDGDRSDNFFGNLIVLCPNHHAMIHRLKKSLEDLRSGGEHTKQNKLPPKKLEKFKGKNKK